MEIQDKKFVIACCSVDSKNNCLDLNTVYGKDALDAMLYFLDSANISAFTWSSPEQLQDWARDRCNILINYIEV